MRHHAAWLAAAILLACAAPAQAATFDVTKPADGADGACDGDCSLREAVIAANQTPGADTITLHTQTYALGIANPIDPDPEADTPKLGDLDVTDQLTIEGSGVGASIVDGGAIDRVFDIAAGASVRMTGLEVRNGRVGRARSGAGIRNDGALELVRVAIAHNDSTGTGGGILNTGTLAMTDSVVADNHGVATGGIANRGTATLTGVTLAGNAGAEAPAALDNRGTATVTNSTVSGSRTAEEGISVASSDGRLELRNVTLGANDGGGGDLLAALFDGQVAIVNSIVDGSCEGLVTSLGHNVEHGHSCGLANAGDLVDSDPLLEPLADNGGPTPTRLPAAGSPAIDAGDDGACPGSDQRGVARPQGAHCDAGAVERAAGATGNTPTGTNVTVVAGPVTITFAHVTAAGDTTVTPGGSGPAPPAGFTVDGSFYELATTAQFDTAEVCFSYGAPPPAIGHFEGGAWRILDPARDTGSAVCAQVSSFSPFALLRAKSVNAQLTELVEQVVAASRLSPAVKALLVTRLRAAIAGFDPTNPAQRRAVCLALGAFTALVRVQAGHAIPAAQAAEWIAAATRISGLLGRR